MTATKTAGQALTAELRKNFGIGTRTRRTRKGLNLTAEMIDAIENATRYPGYYQGARHEAFAKAWVIACSWRKHVDGYRIDGLVQAHLRSLSPWQFAALLGRMVDAGISTVFDAEIFFQNMARDLYAKAA